MIFEYYEFRGESHEARVLALVALERHIDLVRKAAKNKNGAPLPLS